MQKSFCWCSTEAEYIAATEAAKEAEWLSSFFNGIGCSVTLPTILYGDNCGANFLTSNPAYHSRTKHIHIKHRYITELVEQKRIAVRYCNTKNMIADVFTKALPREQFCRLRDLMGIKSTNLLTSISCTVLLAPKTSTSSPPFPCNICSCCFPSRNQLFLHLSQTGHFLTDDLERLHKRCKPSSSPILS